MRESTTLRSDTGDMTHHNKRENDDENSGPLGSSVAKHPEFKSQEDGVLGTASFSLAAVERYRPLSCNRPIWTIENCLRLSFVERSAY